MEQYFNMFNGNENIAFYKIGDSFEDFRIMYENKVANSGQVNLQTIINGINNLKNFLTLITLYYINILAYFL